MTYEELQAENERLQKRIEQLEIVLEKARLALFSAGVESGIELAKGVVAIDLMQLLPKR